MKIIDFINIDKCSICKSSFNNIINSNPCHISDIISFYDDEIVKGRLLKTQFCVDFVKETINKNMAYPWINFYKICPKKCLEYSSCFRINTINTINKLIYDYIRLDYFIEDYISIVEFENPLTTEICHNNLSLVIQNISLLQADLQRIKKLMILV